MYGVVERERVFSYGRFAACAVLSLAELEAQKLSFNAQIKPRTEACRASSIPRAIQPKTKSMLQISLMARHPCSGTCLNFRRRLPQPLRTDGLALRQSGPRSVRLTSSPSITKRSAAKEGD